MSFRLSRLMLVLAGALALAACEAQPVAQKLPELSFADKRPFQLNVGQLEIVPEYQPTGRKPNVEHLMPLSPENATVRWAQDRLRPMGKSGFARVLIKDAKVVEVPLSTDKGFTGMFKDQQSERYDGSLDVAIQILDERHFPIADVVARATRSHTVAEGATLNERDKVMFELSEGLIRDIDSQMESLVRTYLSRWVMN
ncbi:MAG: hypothetical protein LDL39_16170 [Magnetospirillum sp.]|nr:hypothetical protein [Magnetospirillum sp.]